MINIEDAKKNKKLIDYEDIKDTVIANSIKKMQTNKKTKIGTKGSKFTKRGFAKEKEQDRLLCEF
ncbi:hypothetical protein GF343_05785 [Candidatus Woesearchaeota archaeon]|nr:hypothetical protein [Candidatus Woesearchaeota archaeon]